MSDNNVFTVGFGAAVVLVFLGVAAGFLMKPDNIKAITVLWSEVDKTGSKLSDIEDANPLSTATNGQIIYRNNNKWTATNTENTIVSLPWNKVNKVGSSINDMGDVTVNSPTNGQVLKWNGNQWVNANDDTGSAGAHSLNSHTDTDFTGVNDKFIIYYDIAQGKWKVIDHKLDNVKDVNAPTPSNNQVLRYDSITNNWVNDNTENTITSLPWNKVSKTGSILDDIGDVVLNSPSVGQVLEWDGSKWVNANDDTGSGGGYANIINLGHFDPNNSADDTTTFQNAVDNCPSNGCILKFSGIADLNNLIINKNYITIEGINGYHSDTTGLYGSAIRQVSTSNPAINLIRQGSSKSIGVNDDHLYGFRLKDVMLIAKSGATVPILDSIDFKMRSGEGSLQTKAIKSLAIERVTIFAGPMSNSAPAAIRLYNPDINPYFEHIRINDPPSAGLLLISSNHNSGNIYMNDITARLEPSHNSRIIVLLAGEGNDGGNLSFGLIQHVRSFGSTSDNVYRNYAIEIIAKSGDARYIQINNVRTEETPFLYAHSDGSGDVENIIVYDWTYRDRRLQAPPGENLEKIGIVLNDTSTASGTVQNVHISDGQAIRGANVGGNVPPNITYAIYDRGINTLIEFNKIYFENVNSRINVPTTINYAKYIEQKFLTGSKDVPANTTSSTTFTLNIPHGLGYTPSFNDILFSYNVDNTTSISFSIPPHISAIDENNITIRFKASNSNTTTQRTVTFYVMIQ